MSSASIVTCRPWGPKPAGSKQAGARMCEQSQSEHSMGWLSGVCAAMEPCLGWSAMRSRLAGGGVAPASSSTSDAEMSGESGHSFVGTAGEGGLGEQESSRKHAE